MKTNELIQALREKTEQLRATTFEDADVVVLLEKATEEILRQATKNADLEDEIYTLKETNTHLCKEYTKLLKKFEEVS